MSNLPLDLVGDSCGLRVDGVPSWVLFPWRSVRDTKECEQFGAGQYVHKADIVTVVKLVAHHFDLKNFPLAKLLTTVTAYLGRVNNRDDQNGSIKLRRFLTVECNVPPNPAASLEDYKNCSWSPASRKRGPPDGGTGGQSASKQSAPAASSTPGSVLLRAAHVLANGVARGADDGEKEDSDDDEGVERTPRSPIVTKLDALRTAKEAAQKAAVASRTDADKAVAAQKVAEDDATKAASSRQKAVAAQREADGDAEKASLSKKKADAAEKAATDSMEKAASASANYGRLQLQAKKRIGDRRAQMAKLAKEDLDETAALNALEAHGM